MASTSLTSNKNSIMKEKTFFKRLKNDLIKNRNIYIMLIPVVAYYLIFHYQPMYGAQIAFKDFNPSAGIWGSEWVGFKHFKAFFESYYFWRLLRNTVLINLYDVLFGFPAPIILALLLNEITNNKFKRTVQTVTYVPHFISMVVICGIIIDFLSTDGVINQIISTFGIEPIQFMIRPEWFRTIYISSGIWQQIGWGTIIYLAVLSNINPGLYEAAKIDGASRLKQTMHITIPGIMPTIIIMLILRMGKMMNVGVEKVLLLYNTNTYETADVISSFVYRKGLLENNYSYSTAIDLFNSVINFFLLITVNRISKKVTDTSLW